MTQRPNTVVDFDPVHTGSYFTGIFRDLDTPDVLDPLLKFSGKYIQWNLSFPPPARIYFYLKTSIYQGAPVTVCLSLLDNLVLL